MSKMHDPPEPMQSEFQRGYAPPQPQNYMAGPPGYTPASHMPPEPNQPVFQQPMPAAPFPPPPVLIQPIQQQTTYFGQDPTPTVCTHCRNNVVTQVRPINGKITYTSAILCCVFGCYICCFFPFCMDSLQDVEHFCPECGVALGLHKRW